VSVLGAGRGLIMEKKYSTGKIVKEENTLNAQCFAVKQHGFCEDFDRHHHHLSQEKSTAGHRPKVLHDDRSCAVFIQRLPATFTRSSVHLVGDLPTLRLPERGRHSRTFSP
jgi:hypothetical protein